MHADMWEAGSLDEVLDGGDSPQAKLEHILHCKSPFHAHVDKAAEFIRSNRGLIDSPRHNFAILDPLIENIESRIFFAREADELAFSVKHDRDSLKLLNDAYCSWETALEQIFAKRLCSGSASSLHDYRLNKRFQRLLQRETSLLRGKNPRRALFIGSGPFPISAIWLHRNLGIPVDGLDVSLDAVERSRELIDKLGLSGSIGIIHEDSRSYNVSEYDVIIVALLAKPKQLILENIHSSAKDSCEIICRTSFGLRSVIYEPTLVTHEILERFSIEDARIVTGSTDDTISSLLLKKLPAA
ncbi:nicotianamine synthase family protein [Tahibacter harae]|uniref:Nicotianamine synthase-like protein n=1 Tax=Tahibacter harae TaxID=2963937 RepID=A0ABT1QM61_9GAMM|nr:hypothetical protein [Tahibacter harae]